MGLVTRHPQEHLLAYCERRLGPVDREQLEAHLAVCKACREQAMALGSVAELLGAMPAALRALPSRAQAQWPAVWAQVNQGAVRGIPAGRLAPRRPVYFSLVVAALTVVLAWPGVFEARTGVVTAGVADTPRQAAYTPQAVIGAGPNPRPLLGEAVSTARQLAVPDAPVAASTPIPRNGS